MGHLRKATSTEKSPPKREAMRATATSNAVVAGSHKPFGVQILPQIAPDAGHGSKGFNVCPAHFGLALISFLSIPQFLLFRRAVFTLCLCMSAMFSFVFISTGAHS